MAQPVSAYREEIGAHGLGRILAVITRHVRRKKGWQLAKTTLTCSKAKKRCIFTPILSDLSQFFREKQRFFLDF